MYLFFNEQCKINNFFANIHHFLHILAKTPAWQTDVQYRVIKII